MIVKENEFVTTHDPTKEIVYRPPKPFRTIVVSFSVMPGKYAVIPILSGIKDQTSRYTLRLYFGSEKGKIQFHSKEPKIEVLQYIDRTTGSKCRNPLFMAEKSSKFSATNPNNPFARKVMVPYSLDGIINTVKVPKSRTQTVETEIAKNKKNFEQSTVFYEDNAKGSVSSQKKLFNAADVVISEQTRQQALLGTDPNDKLGDPDYIAKLSPEEQ